MTKVIIVSYFLIVAASFASITPQLSSSANTYLSADIPKISYTETTTNPVQWVVRDFWGKVVNSGINNLSPILPKPANGGIGYFSIILNEMQQKNIVSTTNTAFTIISPTTNSSKMYGVDTHFAQGYPKSIIPLIALAGISQNRDELYWSDIEPTKNHYTTEKFQSYMVLLKKSNITPLITLDWGNTNYDYTNNIKGINSTYNAPFTTNGFAGFGAYSKFISTSYGNQIPALEVWNEYNSGYYTKGYATTNSALNYYKLLKKVKLSNPKKTIVGMVSYPVALGWISHVLKNGTGADTANHYLDVVAIHPYRSTPEGVDTEIKNLQTIIKNFNNGTTKPIWATEFADLESAPEVLTNEPSYLVRMVTIMQTAGVARMYYYQAQDDWSGRMGLISQAGYPNQAYAAYHTAINQLANWSPLGQVTNGFAPTTYVYKFTNPKHPHPKYVIWGGTGNRNAPTSLTLPDDASYKVTDMMGNVSTNFINNIIPVSGVNPIYLETSSRFNEEKNRVLADSIAGYGSQNESGWSYGIINWSYSSNDFQAMTSCIWGDYGYEWMINQSTLYPFQQIDILHPFSKGYVVRRWTSNTSASVTISGTIKGPTLGSTGTVFTIWVNNMLIYSSAILTPNTSNNYSVTANISPSSNIDFALAPNGDNISFDATEFTARVTKNGD